MQTWWSVQFQRIQYRFKVNFTIENSLQVRRSPLQCHQCQACDHTKNHYHYHPKCVKCGEITFPRNAQKTEITLLNLPRIILPILKVTLL